MSIKYYHLAKDEEPPDEFCAVRDIGGEPSEYTFYVNELELHDENVKLRGLVKRMHEHIKECCDGCDGWYCSSFDEDNECCVYDTLARELGVEVNQ